MEREEEDFVTQVWDVDLSDADPVSLKFGHFYERHIRYAPHREYWLREKDVAAGEGRRCGVAIIMARLVDEARTRLAELDGAR